MTRSPDLLPDWLRRPAAAAAAALVLLLNILAVSPRAHAWVHGGCDHAHPVSQDREQDHGCAVTLFSSGVALPLAGVAVAAPDAIRHATCTAVPAELYLASPRYLRQPERGPPAC